MARQSSIDRLPGEVVAEIERLFSTGRTLDEVLDHLRALPDVSDVPSRSALGRHRKEWADLRERLTEGRQMAEAFARELGANGQTDADQLAIELASNLATRALADRIGDDEVDALELTRLARVVRQMVLARGNLAETEGAIRKELRDQTLAKIDAAEKDASAGADPMAMIRRIRQDVYGIYDQPVAA